MSNDRPTSNPRRDDDADRADRAVREENLERRATDEDRRRLDEGSARRRDDDRRVEGDRRLDGDRRVDEAGTRPMATRGERVAVAPGAARGRLHVGINWGSAFFGWIAATGLAVILTALVAAVGAAVGVSRGTTTAQQASDAIQQNSQTVGIAGLVLLAVVAFVSYYAGGYVAARMSRFDGPRQGFAVWLWAIIVAVVVAIAAAVAGAKYDVLSTLNTFPRIPVNQGDLTGTGIVALVALLVITLLGAVIGGAGGMRYHRKLETAEAEYLTGGPEVE